MWVAMVRCDGGVDHALPMRGTTPVPVGDWCDYPAVMGNLLGGLLVRPHITRDAKQDDSKTRKPAWLSHRGTIFTLAHDARRPRI